jgi:L-2-hydroxyglutarate oxidase LhgO
MTYEVDCVVVGAGVVGLAVARELQLAGIETVLLERHAGIGMETSSRNSEVVHAGIYYPTETLKASLCVRGRRLLYEYCERRSVPHNRLGKIIVAVEQAEAETLEAYLASATANGVTDLYWLSIAEIAKLEPSIRAHSGLMSPSTGIIDGQALMLALKHDFEQAGGTTVFHCPVESGVSAHNGIELQLGDEERTVVRTSRLVNSAGLHAPAVARSIENVKADAIPTVHYAIGHYFLLAGKSPFRHLVYPIAESGGLGVHVTLDMAGAARFGPDLSWRSSVDHAFDTSRAPGFYRSIRRYFPALGDGELQPGYTGIRPKIAGPEDPVADFLIQNDVIHGVPGLVNLFGIESPGLTSALAIAECVREQLK